MESLFQPSRWSTLFILVVGAVVLTNVPSAMSQATISMGSIQGTVTDPSGAIVPNAKITITLASSTRSVQAWC